MDVTKAALVVAAVYALTEWAKTLYPKLTENTAQGRRLTVAAALVSGQAAVWGLATTVWAHDQVIGNVSLDRLNTGSKFVAGFFVALAATAGHKLLETVKNVGQNQTLPVDQDHLQ